MALICRITERVTQRVITQRVMLRATTECVTQRLMMQRACQPPPSEVEEDALQWPAGDAFEWPAGDAFVW